MSAAVTAGGAAAGADPFAGDALETVSVCAQTPIVNTGIRTVKSKVLFRFMEVRFSPLSSLFCDCYFNGGVQQEAVDRGCGVDVLLFSGPIVSAGLRIPQYTINTINIVEIRVNGKLLLTALVSGRFSSVRSECPR